MRSSRAESSGASGDELRLGVGAAGEGAPQLPLQRRQHPAHQVQLLLKGSQRRRPPRPIVVAVLRGAQRSVYP